MGGLGKRAAVDLPPSSSSARCHSPGSRRSRASSRRTRSSPSAIACRAATASLLWVFGILGAVPDRALHVPDALHRLLGRAVAVRARAPARREHTDRAAGLDGVDGRACSPCSRSSAAGSSSPGSGTRSRTGSSRSPSRSSRRAGTQELVASIVIAWRSGSAGICVAWAIYSARKSSRARRLPRAASACSSTSSTSTSSTTASSTGRPSGSRRRSTAWIVEEPLVVGSIDAIAASGSRAGRGREVVQTGLVRTYALAIAARASPSSLSSSWRCADERVAHNRADRLPGRSGARRLAGALVESGGRLARAAGRARRGRPLDQRARRASTSTTAGSSSSSRRTWFSDLGVSYHVGLYGFSLWLVGMTVVVMAAAIAYAFWAGRETAARLLRADALPDRGDRRRLRGAGPPPLLRLLRGDADPALRARRRLGRAGAARRDDQVRHLHDGRARC